MLEVIDDYHLDLFREQLAVWAISPTLPKPVVEESEDGEDGDVETKVVRRPRKTVAAPTEDVETK